MKQYVLIFAALMLVPLAVLHADRNLSEVPRFGKLRVGFFQGLEKPGRMLSDAWN